MNEARRTSDADTGEGERFPVDLLYRAARLYYLQNATQAQVAAALGTSRPTVSRLLADARARGIVHIEVRDPRDTGDAQTLATDLADALGLRRAWVTETTGGVSLGPTLARAVAEAIGLAQLSRGDVLLVSSGATVHAVSHEELPELPGVLMAPTVGGQMEPEAHFQTNEITRQIAVKCHAEPVFLYAPAMPGPRLYQELVADASVRSVFDMWDRASCALLGIGAPPGTRTSLPSVLPRDPSFVTRAVGDICSRPYDAAGHPLEFPGSDRLVAMELEQLRRVPVALGMAVGVEKVPSIRAATQARYINYLVTDRSTALALLADPDAATA